MRTMMKWERQTMKIRNRGVLPLLTVSAFCIVSTLAGAFLTVKASDERDVRAVVLTIFEQLKAGEYGQLYEALPAASRSRIARGRFTEMLRRTSGTYRLERIDVGAIRVSGDIAVVDTVMYGSVQRPVSAEGKIVAQQYLVREGGKWRVATGDAGTVRRFLAVNPGFAKKFPIRNPRVFIKRDGRWIDLSNAVNASRRRRIPPA